MNESQRRFKLTEEDRILSAYGDEMERRSEVLPRAEDDMITIVNLFFGGETRTLAGIQRDFIGLREYRGRERAVEEFRRAFKLAFEEGLVEEVE